MNDPTDPADDEDFTSIESGVLATLLDLTLCLQSIVYPLILESKETGEKFREADEHLDSVIKSVRKLIRMQRGALDDK